MKLADFFASQGRSLDTTSNAAFAQTIIDGVDLLPKRPGLYCILNRVNGKRYVGEASKSLYQRCMQHRAEFKNGRPSSMLLRRDLLAFGADAFFFFALRVDGLSQEEDKRQGFMTEIWFAVQLRSHDERYGYNLEVGHHRTRAARFRDRERKLMRRNSWKYELLPGVDLYDPIASSLLQTWVSGS